MTNDDHLAGVAGPPETLARIRSALAAQAAAADAVCSYPATDAGLMPNPRHTGIYEMLRLHAAGTLEAATGIELTRGEEDALRTYGRCGAAVATLDAAVQVVLQWRAWGPPVAP